MLFSSVIGLLHSAIAIKPVVLYLDQFSDTAIRHCKYVYK